MDRAGFLVEAAKREMERVDASEALTKVRVSATGV